MGTVIKSIYTFGRLKKQNAQVNKKSMLKVMLFLCNIQTLNYFPGGLYLGQESHQQGSEEVVVLVALQVSFMPLASKGVHMHCPLPSSLPD